MADEVTELRIKILSEGVAESKRRLDELTASGRKTETSVKSLGDSAEKNFKKFAVGLVSVSALGAGLAKVTREWVAYDKSMKEVSSIMSTSSDQFQKLRGDVLQLSVAMGVDATVAAKGLYQAVSAGIPQENAFAFMTVAAKTAIANVTDVETSVNVLTNVINAYKLPVSEATNISDKLFSAVLGGKTTMEELSQSMSKGTVPAAALGVSLDELLASIVAITLQGTPTAEAFTQVNATMTALKDPSKEMQSAIEGMGFASSRAAIASIGYGQVLQNLKNLVGDNDLAFNKLFGRIEASNGVISQTGANFALFSKALDSSLNSAGMSADAAAKNSDTLGVSLTRLSSAFTLVMENFENRFHILKNVSELLKQTATSISGQSTYVNALTDNGNVGSAIRVQEKLNSLLARRAELQREIAASPSNTARLAVEAASPLASLLLPESPEKKLVATQNGIKLLTEAVAKFDAETKQAADHFLKLNAINSTNLPKETKAGLMGDMRALWAEETKNALEKKTLIEQDAAASKAADEEKRVRLVELSKLKEVETKEREKTLEEGIKLSVGEVEALDLQITKMQELQNLSPKDAGAIQKSINLLQEKKKVLLDTAAQEEAAMSGMLLPPPLSQKGQTEELKQQIQLRKDLDEQMARVGTTQTELLEKQKASFELEKKQFPEKTQAANKAIAAINAEIRAISDLDAKKSETAAKDQERKEKALADQLERFNLTPIFETPGNNEFEKLQIQEDAIRRSYEKRKADILEIVGATETEKTALLIRNEKQMAAATESIAKERNKAALTATSDFLGNIASIQGAFGEKGFKIAQAAAIAQATIKMYEGAVNAYASGAAIPYIGAVAGPAFAAAAVAAGAANIAQIKSQSYTAYAQGGMIPAGQTGLVGEAGPEFVRGPAIVTSAAATANQRRGKEGSDSKPMQVIINNLPGQSVDMQERDGPDMKTVEFTIAKLTAEAQNGGGKFVPALSRSHGLKRKTN